MPSSFPIHVMVADGPWKIIACGTYRRRMSSTGTVLLPSNQTSELREARSPYPGKRGSSGRRNGEPPCLRFSS